MLTYRNHVLNLIRSCKSYTAAKDLQHKLNTFIVSGDTFVANHLIAMYGRLGMVSDALDVFQSIERDLVSWTVMLTAYATNGYLEEARETFHSIPQHDLVCFSTILAAYSRSGNITETRILFAAVPVVDTVAWATLLSAYAQHGHFEDGEAVFVSMPEHNVIVENIMLVACSRSGSLDKTRKMFHGMIQRDIVSWSTMLRAYAQDGDIEKTKYMFDSMPERDIVSWTSMLAAYIQEQDLENARVALDSMPEKNLVTMNVILAGYVQNGRTEEAEVMFDEEMQFRDVFSWTTMLRGYASKENPTEASEFFETIPEQNLVTWNALLTCYRGDHLKMKQTLDEMPVHDLASLNSLLGAYSQEEKYEECERMFASMPQKDLVSWCSMLTAHSRRGEPENTKCVFDAMPEHNTLAWNTLLAVYAFQGHLLECRVLFEKMPLKTLVSWNIMLAGYAHNGELELAALVYRSMPGHDSVSWNTLLAMYAYSGCSRATIEAFQAGNMHEKADDMSFVFVLVACSHIGELELARICFRLMALDFGIQPTKQHYLYMVDLFGRLGRLEDAEEVLNAMPYVPESEDWACLLGASKSHTGLSYGQMAAQNIISLDSENSEAYVLLGRYFS